MTRYLLAIYCQAVMLLATVWLMLTGHGWWTLATGCAGFAIALDVRSELRQGEKQ